jgi:hypothetical protein
MEKAHIERAILSVKLAYQFNANSYTAWALKDCAAALTAARDADYAEGWIQEYLDF